MFDPVVLLDLDRRLALVKMLKARRPYHVVNIVLLNHFEDTDVVESPVEKKKKGG